MKYLWNDVKIILGGKEIEFTPINNYENVSVFESDIEISFEELIKKTSKEFQITENFEHDKRIGTLEFGRKNRSLIVDGIEIKEGWPLDFDNNQYIVVAVLEDKIILKLTATKIK